MWVAGVPLQGQVWRGAHKGLHPLERSNGGQGQVAWVLSFWSDQGLALEDLEGHLELPRLGGAGTLILIAKRLDASTLGWTPPSVGGTPTPTLSEVLG